MNQADRAAAKISRSPSPSASTGGEALRSSARQRTAAWRTATATGAVRQVRVDEAQRRCVGLVEGVLRAGGRGTELRLDQPQRRRFGGQVVGLPRRADPAVGLGRTAQRSTRLSACAALSGLGCSARSSDWLTRGQLAREPGSGASWAGRDTSAAGRGAGIWMDE